MVHLDNPKIGFKRFSGFSLLFDNPGQNNLKPYYKDYFFLSNDLREIAFYMELDTCFKSTILPKRKDIGFLALPASTFHVTVWDGINSGNFKKTNIKHIKSIENFFIEMPSSLMRSIYTKVINESIPKHKDIKITFCFNKLAISNNVIIAVLKPVDEASKNALHKIENSRLSLSENFRMQFGLPVRKKNYVPHVSLAYFMNKDQAEKGKRILSKWNETFLKNLDKIQITFASISLYGFSDMVSFYKKKDKGSVL